ncbi:MAG: M67 family metallopeptidase [Magnetospirillum sp.]|nr:M67 family metallopeptidase [Magnetospirillum sp.]
MTALQIAATELASIAAAAVAAYPAEACGLLVGRGDRTILVTRVAAAANLLAGSGDRFELDPAVRLAVEKAVRGTEERVVGHWHSHPDAAARPSAIDRAMAFEPELVWLIVPVIAGQAGPPTAWRPTADGNAFRPLPLTVV